MASITLKNLSKKWGPFIAVDNINLEIFDKEFLVLLGPSGCGKTTTMRMIAGLEQETTGEIYINDIKVNEMEPKDRDVAMVFQSYGLYPNMNVFENIRFPLKIRKIDPNTHSKRVERAAEMVELSEYLHRKPSELSGGQRQRVALARAIVREPYNLQNSETKEQQLAARRQLAISVRGHVKDIQDKYIIAGSTAESACLFLPSEAVYAELHANLPDVIDASYKARVWIVSPTTMMATLNTVRAVLRDARLREQTAIIQSEMLKLIEDVSRLDARVENLNRHFSQVQKDISEIQTSTSRISKRSYRITELEVPEDENISVVNSEIQTVARSSKETDDEV